MFFNTNDIDTGFQVEENLIERREFYKFLCRYNTNQLQWNSIDPVTCATKSGSFKYGVAILKGSF